MASLSKSADALMVQYAAYHRDRRNIATHLVGIPLIVLSLAPLLAWLPRSTRRGVEVSSAPC